MRFFTYLALVQPLFQPLSAQNSCKEVNKCDGGKSYSDINGKHTFKNCYDLSGVNYCYSKTNSCNVLDCCDNSNHVTAKTNNLSKTNDVMSSGSAVQIATISTLFNFYGDTETTCNQYYSISLIPTPSDSLFSS
jgi:hypothetical protein